MINTVLKPFQFSSFSEERLDRFENRVGELPNDYKAFLIDVNGGEMIKDVLYLEDEFYYVAKLFGLHSTTNYWANIEWFLENESLLFPYKTIPIGDNSWIMYLYFDVPWPMPNSDAVQKFTVNRTASILTITGKSSVNDYKKTDVDRMSTNNISYRFVQKADKTIEITVTSDLN